MKNYLSVLGATILLFTISCQSGEILNEKAELTEEKKKLSEMKFSNYLICLVRVLQN